MRKSFSCGHRYDNLDWSKEKNQEVFGYHSAEDGLGHNFDLDLSFRLEGNSWEEQQEICEHWVKTVAQRFDHCFVNQKFQEFKKGGASVEALAMSLAQFARSMDSHPHIQVHYLKLWEDQLHRAEVDFATPDQVKIAKQYKINCVHRHHNPDLSMDENLRLYNKCSRVHGHEYKFEVVLVGVPDRETSLLISRNYLDQIVYENILKPLDKSFLNEKLGNTSGEKIALQLQQRLKPHLKSKLETVIVRETRKNSFAVGSHFPQ